MVNGFILTTWSSLKKCQCILLTLPPPPASGAPGRTPHQAAERAGCWPRLLLPSLATSCLARPQHPLQESLVSRQNGRTPIYPQANTDPSPEDANFASGALTSTKAQTIDALSHKASLQQPDTRQWRRLSELPSFYEMSDII